MKRHDPTVWAIAAASLAYATLRYNVFQGVPWSDWPVYVLNKALALSSLLLMLAWTLRARHGPGALHGGLLAAGSRFALAHVGFSLAILSPAYFPAFFNGARLTWQGSVSLLIGMSTAAGLVTATRAQHGRHLAVQRMGLVTIAAGLHAACYGYPGWFTPSAWPGHLPPITLLSAAAGIVGLGAAWFARQRPSGSRGTVTDPRAGGRE